MVPAQRPANSRQDYTTPFAFLAAVERLVGPIAVDLAADTSNHVCERWLGPGGEVEDAFAVPWAGLAPRQLLWLNPPFGAIGRWVERAEAAKSGGARVAVLTPASVGSEWFARWVAGRAAVLFLRPRLSFDRKAPYPKDLMLSLYGWVPGWWLWDWASGEAPVRV